MIPIGSYFVVSIDPVAMVRKLEDPEATRAAQAMSPKKYAGYISAVRRFDFYLIPQCHQLCVVSQGIYLTWSQSGGGMKSNYWHKGSLSALISSSSNRSCVCLFCLQHRYPESATMAPMIECRIAKDAPDSSNAICLSKNETQTC